MKYVKTVVGILIMVVVCALLSYVITKSKEVGCYNNSFLSLVKQPAVKSAGIVFYGGEGKVYKTSDSFEETGYSDLTIPKQAKVCVSEVVIIKNGKNVVINLAYATWRGENNMLYSKFIDTGVL